MWENVLREDSNGKTGSSQRIYGKCPSHLSLKNNRDRSHSVATAIFQREYRVVVVGGSVLRVRDCQGELLQNCTNDRSEYAQCVFEDLGPVKRSDMLESQDSCPISSWRTFGLRGRNNVQICRTNLKRMGQQN